MTSPAATGFKPIPKVLQLSSQYLSSNDRQSLDLITKEWTNIPKKLPSTLSQLHAMSWLLAAHQEQPTEHLLSMMISWGINRDGIISAAIVAQNKSILTKLAATRDEITHAITTREFAIFLVAFESNCKEFIYYLTSHLSAKQINKIVSSESFTNIASFLDMPEIYQWAHENHPNFAKKLDDSLLKKLELGGYNVVNWIVEYRADYFKQLIMGLINPALSELSSSELSKANPLVNALFSKAILLNQPAILDFIKSCTGNLFRYLVSLYTWRAVSQAYQSSADKIISWFNTHLFSANESPSRFDFILTQNIVNKVLNQLQEQGMEDPILLKPIQYSMIQWLEKLKNTFDNASPQLEPLPFNIPKSILIEVINQKNLYLLHQLLSYVAIDVNFQKPNRTTALTLAASLGNRAACERLLKVPGINPNLTSNASRSAIWEGCYRGRNRNLDEHYLEITKSILVHPDTLVNLQDFLGMTVLHLACYNGLALHVEALLKHPTIDLTLVDKIGETALHKSIYHNPFDSGGSGYEMGPVIRETEIPQVLIARALLKKEPRLINMKNLEGSTILHHCVKNAEDELVAELLKYPTIQVNERDLDGKSALHYACQYNMFHCARYLYNHPDIDRHLLDNQGNPPWFYIDNQTKEAHTSWFFTIDKTELKTLFAAELNKANTLLTAEPDTETIWASPLTYCGLFRLSSEHALDKTEKNKLNLRHSM